jgi:hypothetical protein
VRGGTSNQRPDLLDRGPRSVPEEPSVLMPSSGRGRFGLSHDGLGVRARVSDGGPVTRVCRHHNPTVQIVAGANQRPEARLAPASSRFRVASVMSIAVTRSDNTACQGRTPASPVSGDPVSLTAGRRAAPDHGCIATAAFGFDGGLIEPRGECRRVRHGGVPSR